MVIEGNAVKSQDKESLCSIVFVVFLSFFYATDLKGQLKESRPTKNDGEIVSAAGVTRPQIPGTYWTSTPRWRALRSCIFVYGLLAYCLQ